MLSKQAIQAMVVAAGEARENAYAPYSGFKVGAAVLGASNKVYLGCNVENASYGLAVCAERVAIAKAVSEGERSIDAIAIVAGDASPARPCGACLQVIAEFASKDMIIIAASADLDYDIHTLDHYLPLRFELPEQA